jgi:hypothetical protein
MISKKYAKDYEIVYDAAPDGRLKTEAVYKGKCFVFTDTAENVKKTAKYFTVLSAVVWIAFLAPLSVLSAAARTSYVIFPHACIFFPLLFISAVTIDLWTAKPPFNREKRDHISQRAPRYAFLSMVFSGAAAAGFVTSLFLNPDAMLPGDLLFGLCEAIVLAASILLFIIRGRTATRETE